MLDETLVVWTGEMGRTPQVGQSVPAARARAGTAAITGAKCSRRCWPAVA